MTPEQFQLKETIVAAILEADTKKRCLDKIEPYAKENPRDFETLWERFRATHPEADLILCATGNSSRLRVAEHRGGTSKFKVITCPDLARLKQVLSEYV